MEDLAYIYCTLTQNEAQPDVTTLQVNLQPDLENWAVSLEYGDRSSDSLQNSPLAMAKAEAPTIQAPDADWENQSFPAYFYF